MNKDELKIRPPLSGYKSCDNCKFRSLSAWKDPCIGCGISDPYWLYKLWEDDE